MMKVAAAGEMPNHRIANGTQASPGIGRSSRTTHESAASRRADMPVSTPRPIPILEPINRPTT